MQQANKLFVVGIGYRPLGKRAQELVLRADVLLASSRLYDVFQRYAEYEKVKDRIKVINKVPDTIAFIRDRLSSPSLLAPHASRMSIVLLASGDPLLFGIGRRMITEFGSENVEIHPDLSSMQEAFARINEAWDDAVFISLHGGPDIAKRRTLPYEVEDIPRLLEHSGKMGVLTDRENNPVVIGRVLQSAFHSPKSSIIMFVCERLGYPDEKITRGAPEEITGMSFSDPNVVIIQKTEKREQKTGEEKQGKEEVRSSGPEFHAPQAALFRESIRFGLTEDDILHSRGSITKDEVRAVTIHKLRVPQKGTFWDIGAGSGSLSLEAARLCPGLRIIAVEKDGDRIGTLRSNVFRFNIGNVDVIHGTAPDALRGLPGPDRVFVGGSGGNLNEIVEFAAKKMPSGIMVVNAVAIDTLHDAVSCLESLGFAVEVSEVSVSRSKVVAGKRLLSALNPVFVVKGERS